MSVDSQQRVDRKTLFTRGVKPEGFAVSKEFSMMEKIHRDFLEEKANVIQGLMLHGETTCLELYSKRHVVSGG